MLLRQSLRFRILFSAAAVLLALNLTAAATPLDDYIATPDPAFTYGPTPASVITIPEGTATVWYMASGTWRTSAEVDRTLWEHWVTVFVPNTVSHSKALMVVSGGSNRPTPPTSFDMTLAQIAASTGTIVANVAQIPNERLKFTDETDPRYTANGRNEDEIIAYAWDKFLITGDPLWLPRLPMTRAVVRAMDVVQAQRPDVQSFLVAGASKRGQTTWLTGAVDARVDAVVPMVIDYVNFEPSLQNHWDAYGFWAPAVQDYVDMDIVSRLHTPEFRALCAIVDPYSYLDQLTEPKYVMNSTGDQFFLPDASKYYFGALKGEKYLRYVPNTNHGIDTDPVAMKDFIAYYESYVNGTPRPQFSWTTEPNGAIRVQTTTTPSVVRLWQAANPSARDFRLEAIGAVWTSSVLADQGGGLYVGQVERPAQGWAAFLVELEFPSGGSYPFHFTTDVNVIPDLLPFGDRDGDDIVDTLEETADPDEDGIANYLDPDSDSDGVSDHDEWFIWHTNPYDPDIPDEVPVDALPCVPLLLVAALVILRRRGRVRPET